MLNSKGEAVWLFHQKEAVRIEISYQINQAVESLVFGVGILRLDGVCLHGTNTDIESVEAPLPENNSSSYPLKGKLSYTIESLQMLEGSYHLDIAAHKPDGTPYDYHHELFKFSVRSKIPYQGVYVPEHSWEFKPEYEVAKGNDLSVKRA